MARRHPRYFTIDEALSVALGELDLDFVGEELDEDCGLKSMRRAALTKDTKSGTSEEDNVGGGSSRLKLSPTMTLATS